MEPQTQNLKFQRQRRFLMVVPLLVLPFITAMFWALGGGKASDVGTQTQMQKGFNTDLPDPFLQEDKALDKLSYYEMAASDSARMEKLIKKDPYYSQLAASNNDDQELTSSTENELKYKSSGISQTATTPITAPNYTDPNEAKVYEKLEQLNKALNESSPIPISQEISNGHLAYSSPGNGSVNGPDIERLEQMMQELDQPEGEDPELQQLNGMLEKILDIQHPDRVQEKLRQLSAERKGEVYAVSLNSSTDLVSLIDQGSITNEDVDHLFPLSEQNNAFYSFDDLKSSSEAANAIAAVIHETQTLSNGSTVKLRLVNDVYINGVLVPKDNFLFGTASLNGERLNIKINSIRYGNSLFPVALSVYDMDGLDGIYIPGAITRDAAKQSTDRALQSIGLTTLDPTLGAQAAGAGIETAQNLLSKKIKLVKVTVKAGYKVLLLDEKQNL